jgi:hypothetical protein
MVVLLPACNSHLLSPVEIISGGISRLFPVFSTYKYFKVYQRLETAQMKFLRHLLGITKLDKEKNECIRGKYGSTEHSKGNKTVPGKVATTHTEDGHK